MPWIQGEFICMIPTVYYTNKITRLDKKNFLEKNESAFKVPKKFEYQPVRRDETELVQKPVVEVIIFNL